jgi:hypothetical protein
MALLSEKERAALNRRVVQSMISQMLHERSGPSSEPSESMRVIGDKSLYRSLTSPLVEEEGKTSGGLNMAEEIVRCPYCVSADEFWPMKPRTDGWFLCVICGHSAVPKAISKPTY